LFALVGCGSDPVSVPKVAGLRLDNAHNVVKDAGFKKFDDVDGIASRTAMMDSNWVVLSQTPGADQRAKTSVSVKLEIAKPGDPGVRERLPADSPVLADLQNKDAAADQQGADEAKRQENDAKKKAEAQATKAQSFVDKVDPLARLAKNALTDLNALAQDIAGTGAVSTRSSARLQDIKLSLGVYKTSLDDAPDKLTAPTDQLLDSVDGLVRAANTLLSADGASARGSLGRFRQV